MAIVGTMICDERCDLMRQRVLESREMTRMETIGRVAAGAGHHFNKYSHDY